MKVDIMSYKFKNRNIATQVVTSLKKEIISYESISF